MNKNLFVFTAFVFVVESAWALTSYTYNAQTDNYSLLNFAYDNVTIESGATIAPENGYDIKIGRPTVTLYNNGVVTGRINTDGNNIILYNTGTIANGITNTNNGHVVQIVSSDQENNFIDVNGGNYRIEVIGYNGLNFSDIKNTGSRELFLNNATIEIDNLSEWQNWNADVTFYGSSCLRIDNIDVEGEVIEVNNISNSENVRIDLSNVDNLHKASWKKTPNGIVLYVVRESSYDKIFDDGRGAMLNEIRLLNPGDKTLIALDNAHGMNEINSIMNNSYHFNPRVLMKPMKTVNNFILMDDMVSDKNDYGAGVKFFYVMSDKIDNYGGSLYAGHNYNDFYFKAGFNFNRFSFSDNLNDFDANVYGADIRAKYYMEKLWFDGKLGFNLYSFDADKIYSGNEITSDPMGKSWFSRLVVGYDYDWFDGMVLSPFAGMLFQKSSVLNVSESVTNPFVGGGAKYSFVTDGIKYEYVANVSIDNKAQINFETKIGFWSVTDDAGASIGFDVFKDEFDMNYKFSATAKMLF